MNDSTIIYNLTHGPYKHQTMKVINSLFQNENKGLKKLFVKLCDNKNNQSDKYIFKKLTEKAIKIDSYDEKQNARRAQNKWRCIRKYLPHNVRNYMDYGGNCGDIARILGTKMHLSKENITVVDTLNWAGRTLNPRSDITFVDFMHMKRIKSNSMNLITCFHVLHHLKPNDLKVCLTNICRILRHDARLIILEHNSWNEQWSNIIDMKHKLFDIVLNKTATYDNFHEKCYSLYRSSTEWTAILSRFGFNEIQQKHIHNNDNSYYGIFTLSKN